MGEVELDDDVCLADAAAVLTARRGVDPLLARLAAQPFDAAAVTQLRRWIDEVYPLVAPAWRRLHALAEPVAPAVPVPLGLLNVGRGDGDGGAGGQA